MGKYNSWQPKHQPAFMFDFWPINSSSISHKAKSSASELCEKNNRRLPACVYPSRFLGFSQLKTAIDSGFAHILWFSQLETSINISYFPMNIAKCPNTWPILDTL